MKGGFVPSEEQKEIFKFVLEGSGNAVVTASAGSGKTTTLLKVLELIPHDKEILFMAFNASIAKEIKERVPNRNGITVSTVHSFGFSMLRNYNDPTQDENKYRKILRAITESHLKNDNNFIKEFGFSKAEMVWVSKISKLFGDVNKAYYNARKEFELTKFNKQVLSFCTFGRLERVDLLNRVNGVHEMKEISERRRISCADNEHEIAWYLINIGYSYNKIVDYTDMITLPLHLNLESRTFDFVFIDECQDINLCQRLLMINASKKEGGRIISVGDPKQAIYSFCGADHLSYQKLLEIPNTKEFPLSTSYRCHKQIIDLVKDFNPNIRHHEKNVHGKVIENFSYKDLKEGDMVVCRNSYPTISLCINLLSENKKARLIGSDIGKSLIKLIEGSERKRIEYNMENVYTILDKEKEKLINKLVEKDKLTLKEAREHQSVDALAEKINAIECIAGDETDPKKVIAKITELFRDDKKEGVILSTIHKAKGLEAERVFLLDPSLIPSKYAVYDWEIEQENNLRYVAITRAKTTYGRIFDYDAYGRHKKKSLNQNLKMGGHFGVVGTKSKVELSLMRVSEFNSKFGLTKRYELIDDDNNIFVKFGEISTKFLLNDDDDKDFVDVGDKVKFYGIIKEHTEFNGQKQTLLGKISKH